MSPDFYHYMRGGLVPCRLACLILKQRQERDVISIFRKANKYVE